MQENENKLYENGPEQELPRDIPAEVRRQLAEDLNEEATEDLKQDVREAEAGGKDADLKEELKADPGPSDQEPPAETAGEKAVPEAP